MKHKRWHKVVYLAIAFIAFYYVVKKLLAFDQWDYISGRFINEFWFLLVIFQVVLWVLNIGMESLRWRYLLNTFTKVSFSSSVKMVLMGFTTGSISPMKIGEPGGKILGLKKDERPTGILASVYGSYINSTVLFLIALFIFPVALSSGLLSIPVSFQLSLFSSVILGICILLGSYVIVYFFFRQIKKHVRNSKWALKPEFFNSFRLNKFPILFLYTLIRVIVYNVQLYIWFRFFNITDLGLDFFLLSPLYFAAITLIPAIFLFDLGIRGSVGVYIFSSLSNNLGAVLSALFFLWFLNVALPVLWGSLLLIRSKSHKKQANTVQ